MRLIDADGLKERLKEYCIDGDKKTEEHYEKMGIDDCVDNAPTIDAVEVVRCKDCKYSKHLKQYPKVNTWKCTLTDVVYRADDFCSYGERMEDDDNL